MADQKVMKKRLKALMTRPENQVCSDCPERQPRWASIIVPPPGAPPGTLPLGAFCCLECSGSHRRLGVHISFVRSVNLDSWKEKEVLAMENGGNGKVNMIFEARLSQSGVQKPSNHADGPTRERFIRDKYERRKFYDPGAFAHADLSAPTQHEDIVLPALGDKQQAGPPSDAARQRIQQRKARVKKSSSYASDDGGVGGGGEGEATSRRRKQGGGSKKSSSRSNIAKAPASAPPPSLDLLDLQSDPAPARAPEHAQSFQSSFSNGGGQDMLDFLSASAAETAPPTKLEPQTTTGAVDMGSASKKPSSASVDIMSLYAPSTTTPQQSFAPNNSNFGATMNNMSNMMQNMSMGGGGGMQNMSGGGMQNMGGMTQQQMLYQQQLMMQQQQMAMMQQQQQNAMRGGGGMNNAMGMPQGHMQQGNMMMQQNNGGGFGGSAMGSGPSMSMMQQQQPNGKRSQKAKKAPEKEDPFAQFGSNVFRS